MSKLTVVEDAADDWSVWIGLDNEEPPYGCTFILSTGTTRAEALALARVELHARLVAVARLEADATPPAQTRRSP